MSEPQEQVIHFTIHNPNAPNIQCGVMTPIDPSGPMRLGNYRRCGESASMALVKLANDNTNRYLMRAYCERHWEMKDSGGQPA